MDVSDSEPAVVLPGTAHLAQGPPDAAEAAVLGRGIVTAVKPPGGLQPLQRMLLTATFDAMTGFPGDLDAPPIGPDEFAAALAHRNLAFRSRIVQLMLLGELVLRPIPPEVAHQVDRYARALGVDDGMLQVADRFACGCLGLAAHDFRRNGYMADWTAAQHQALHTSLPLEDPWGVSVNDPALAGQWCALEDLPAGTLGRRVSEFYRARGFVYPGLPGSAPPLLAQHDWVHVLADYGTTVECELEVFALIARANEDPRGFSLLAMVVSLFETGYLASGAGFFEASPGQLSHEGVAVRLADGMRRGALVEGGIDFLAQDWFELADQPVEQLRERFGIVPKSPVALAAGSVGPWEPGGISEFQSAAGHAAAAAAGVPYDSFGACVS